MLIWFILAIAASSFIITTYCLLKIASDCDEFTRKMIENKERI